jgi:predicted O-methyltransferase YrrM
MRIRNTADKLEFLEKVTRIFEGGKPFDLVFLDIADGFDKLPR